jgi:hypothetical protein
MPFLRHFEPGFRPPEPPTSEMAQTGGWRRLSVGGPPRPPAAASSLGPGRVGSAPQNTIEPRPLTSTGFGRGRKAGGLLSILGLGAFGQGNFKSVPPNVQIRPEKTHSRFLLSLEKNFHSVAVSSEVQLPLLGCCCTGCSFTCGQPPNTKQLH